MKRILSLVSIALFTIQLVRGQKNDTSMTPSSKELYDTYMQKRKTNNIVGWVMLGSGIGMAIGGLGINLDESFNSSKGLWLSYLGGATTLASIPFFISARNNKRKARLALKGEAVAIGNGILYKSNYTAVALRIDL